MFCPAALQGARSLYADMQILYEDNHILVVVKPPNIPVQADKSGDMDMLSMLKAYVKEKYNKPGEAYMGLVHRLDRPVGGVMVFARTSKSAARLSEQFQAQSVYKAYAAIVEGDAPHEARLVDYILPEKNEKRVRVYPAQVEGAKRAELQFHTLARHEGVSCLDITLLTGRKHQIRAQLSAHGYPILYDQRYHKDPKKGQIALYAYAVRITHPTKKVDMLFTSLPKGQAFAPYQMNLRACIAALRDKTL